MRAGNTAIVAVVGKMVRSLDKPTDNVSQEMIDLILEFEAHEREPFITGGGVPVSTLRSKGLSAGNLVIFYTEEVACSFMVGYVLGVAYDECLKCGRIVRWDTVHDLSNRFRMKFGVIPDFLFEFVEQ